MAEAVKVSTCPSEVASTELKKQIRLVRANVRPEPETPIHRVCGYREHHEK